MLSSENAMVEVVEDADIIGSFFVGQGFGLRVCKITVDISSTDLAEELTTGS
jgi:hypothetical protein